MALAEWKTAYKVEHWGEHSYGIEIRVSLHRDMNDNDRVAFDRAAGSLEEALMAETVRLAPKTAKKKAEERKALLDLFGDDAILAEEVPNGYCKSWCCSQRPWYHVTTKKGRFLLGWRKHVIEITWEPKVTGGKTAQALFPGEDVTKADCLIHAYGYDKAKQYVTTLLSC